MIDWNNLSGTNKSMSLPHSLCNYHQMLLHSSQQYKTEVNLTGLKIEVWVWVDLSSEQEKSEISAHYNASQTQQSCNK